jgi:ubiquinone biosynthesis protein COQ4
MALAEAATARPVAAKPEWGRALRALRRLLADHDDTAQVFEIMRALNGPANARNYRRLLATRDGGRIAFEQRELSALLMDDRWLDALPAGSVGAAYREFVRAEQLSAELLAQVSREGMAQIEQPHPYAWFGRRTRDIHDIWHVLTGYGREPLGEACLVAFSFPQTRGPGWGFIALGAISRRRGSRQPHRRAILQAYLRGRRAGWLLGEDYERLLREPLDEARLRLGIAPPTVYDAIPPVLRELPNKRR